MGMQENHSVLQDVNLEAIKEMLFFFQRWCFHWAWSL